MKRYVLLETNCIVETNKEDYEVFVNTLSYGDTQLGQIKLQSDNLLDLLEDKDLIECGNEGNVIQYDYVIDEFHEYKNIVAIWKRQGNIMRRYER